MEKLLNIEKNNYLSKQKAIEEFGHALVIVETL
jgi:hypothetical protein